MKKIVYGIDIKRVMRSKLVLGIADGWLSADGSVIYRALDLKVGLFATRRRSRPERSPEHDPEKRPPFSSKKRKFDRGKDEAGGRHRDGHRLVHRQQHAGSAGVAARSQVRHRARRQICRARLPLPGARRADARPERIRRSPRHALSRRRCRLEPRRHGAGDPRFRPRGDRSLQRAYRHHHGLGRAVDPYHRRERRHRPQQRAQARRPVRGAESDVLDRFGDARRPGSRSRASAIRSRRRARPRTIASAMPTRPSSSASRT